MMRIMLDGGTGEGARIYREGEDYPQCGQWDSVVLYRLGSGRWVLECGDGFTASWKEISAPEAESWLAQAESWLAKNGGG